MREFSGVSFICRKTQDEDHPRRTLKEMGFPMDVPAVQTHRYDLLRDGLSDKLYETPFMEIGSVCRAYLQFLIQRRDRSAAFHLTLQMLAKFHVTREELQHELEQCGIDALTAEDADTLCDIFVYLIETLLPRQIGDLFVDFGLHPHPAYHVFFSLAAERLGIEVCKDYNDSRCGQLIGSTTAGAVKRILAGQSLQQIYENTCATKKDIHNAVSRLYLYSWETWEEAQLSFDLLQIEDALFSLSRRYHYERQFTIDSINCTFDFAVFEENRIILLIDYLGDERMECNDLFSYDEAMERTGKKKEKCLFAGIPLLQFDIWEFEDSDFFPSEVIRRVLRNPSYVQVHAEIRRQKLEEAEAYWNDIWDDEEIENQSLDASPPICSEPPSTVETKPESVMTRDKLIQLIEEAMDCIVFTVVGKGYTILVWPDEGISIVEWNQEETKKIYPDARSLVENFKVDCVPLGDLAGEIIITEYC